MIKTPERTGLLMVAGAAIAWSTSGLFIRAIDADVWTLLVWRGFVGAASILVWMLLRDGVAGLSAFRTFRGQAWSYALTSTFGMVSFITAFKYTSVADVLVIYAIAPFVVAAAAWLWFGEKSTASTMLAAAVALTGVGITVAGATGGANWIGDLLALCMTVSVAAMTVIARRYQAIPMTAAACVSSLLSGLISLPFAAPLSLRGVEMMGAVLFGVIAMGIALSLYSEGARLAPASRVSLVSTLETPLSPLWVWLTFGEQPAVTSLIGGTIVMVAVIGDIAFGARRRAPAADLPS